MLIVGGSSAAVLAACGYIWWRSGSKRRKAGRDTLLDLEEGRAIVKDLGSKDTRLKQPILQNKLLNKVQNNRRGSPGPSRRAGEAVDDEWGTPERLRADETLLRADRRRSRGTCDVPDASHDSSYDSAHPEASRAKALMNHFHL